MVGLCVAVCGVHGVSYVGGVGGMLECEELSLLN